MREWIHLVMLQRGRGRQGSVVKHYQLFAHVSCVCVYVCVCVGGWLGGCSKNGQTVCFTVSSVITFVEYICMRQQVLFNNQECLLPSL